MAFVVVNSHQAIADLLCAPGDVIEVEDWRPLVDSGSVTLAELEQIPTAEWAQP